MRARWTQGFAAGGKLEARIGGSRLHRKASGVLLGFDEPGSQLLERRVNGRTVEDTVPSAGKYRAPYTERHSVGVGWDAAFVRRYEDRVQRDATAPGRTAENLDESYNIKVYRLAAFAQDEWDVSTNLSLYSGIRWEGLRTYSAGGSAPSASSRSNAFSPVAQLLWKISPDDQMRLGLSRTYKAPTTTELSARRFVAPDNTPTTPNIQGNPALRPELAWGLDVSYEHAVGKAGSVLGSAYVRRVEDVILRDVSFIDGAWVLQPYNRGNADVRGVEFESRLSLSKLSAGGPPLDVKLSAIKTWSAVRAVAGPNNRLDGQTPYSGNLGLDYRLPAEASVGANYGVVGGAWARNSATLAAKPPTERKLEVYAAHKATADVRLRLAIGRRWRDGDGRFEELHTDQTGEFRQKSVEKPINSVRLSAEIRL